MWHYVSVSVTDYPNPKIGSIGFLSIQRGEMTIACHSIPVDKAYQIMDLLIRLGGRYETTHNPYVPSIVRKRACFSRDT